jgi:hypothetical protein
MTGDTPVPTLDGVADYECRCPSHGHLELTAAGGDAGTKGCRVLVAPHRVPPGPRWKVSAPS